MKKYVKASDAKLKISKLVKSILSANRITDVIAILEGGEVWGTGYYDQANVYHLWADNLKPIQGLPEGKVRYRFCHNDFARVFVQTPTGVRRFVITTDVCGDNGQKGNWIAVEQGSNAKSL